MFNVGDKVKFNGLTRGLVHAIGGKKTKEASKDIGEVIEFGGKFFQSDPRLPTPLRFRGGGAVQTYKVRWANGLEKEYPEFMLVKVDK